MFRNSFGEAKPVNTEELNEVLDEMQVDTVADISATVRESKPEDGGHEHYHGWNAEITATTFDGDEVTIETGGWQGGKEALLKALAEIDAEVTEEQ